MFFHHRGGEFLTEYAPINVSSEVLCPWRMISFTEESVSKSGVPCAMCYGERAGWRGGNRRQAGYNEFSSTRRTSWQRLARAVSDDAADYGRAPGAAGPFACGGVEAGLSRPAPS